MMVIGSQLDAEKQILIFQDFCCGAKDCCQKKGDAQKENMVFSPLFDPSSFSPYDRTQDPIFPSELQVSVVSCPCM